MSLLFSNTGEMYKAELQSLSKKGNPIPLGLFVNSDLDLKFADWVPSLVFMLLCSDYELRHLFVCKPPLTFKQLSNLTAP